MLPKRNASDRQPTLTHDMVPTAARANRRNRRLCPSRRLALGVILTPLSVLIALGLVQGGAVEGQRAPVTVTLTGSPTPTIPPVGATPTTPPVDPGRARFIVECHAIDGRKSMPISPISMNLPVNREHRMTPKPSGGCGRKQSGPTRRCVRAPRSDSRWVQGT